MKNSALVHKVRRSHIFCYAIALITLTASAQDQKASDAKAPQNGQKIVAAARTQIGKTIIYDPAYVSLSYPHGDIPIQRGVCTDVVIRSLRASLNIDLQKEVHEDMRAHFSKYPTIWGLTKTDRSIDHRRVPNLQTLFKRKGYELTIGKIAADFLPGDLITCTVPPNLPHIMIVSDRKTAAGTPLVLHNIGRGAVEEDRLFDFKITGHYRIPPSTQKTDR